MMAVKTVDDEERLVEQLRRWVKIRTRVELERAKREIEVELSYREKEMVG